jgi:hypothetical protein
VLVVVVLVVRKRGGGVVVTGKGVEIGYNYGEADEVVDEDVCCRHGFGFIEVG